MKYKVVEVNESNLFPTRCEPVKELLKIEGLRMDVVIGVRDVIGWRKVIKWTKISCDEEIQSYFPCEFECDAYAFLHFGDFPVFASLATHLPFLLSFFPSFLLPSPSSFTNLTPP